MGVGEMAVEVKEMMAWVCMVEEDFTSVEELEQYGMTARCRRDPGLYDLDEQEYVREYNQEHAACGFYRMVPEPQFELAKARKGGVMRDQSPVRPFDRP